MCNLLRADLYRYSKDVLLKVMFIVILVMTAMNAGIYWLVRKEFVIGVQYMHAANFSISNNLGLVIPLFAGIVVCKDFTMGTIRNKIIRGYSRTSIYMSHMITAMIFGAFSFLVNDLVTFALTPIFGYSDEFTFDLKYLLITLLVGVCIFAAMSCFTSLLASITRSTGITVILYVVIILATSIISVVALYLKNKVPKFIFDVINSMPHNAANTVLENSKDIMDYSGYLLWSLGIIVVCGIVGSVLFKRADQK